MSDHPTSSLSLETLLGRSSIYAGIGSRSTPPDVLIWIERIAVYLAQRRLILRSGGAPGSDEAFERGCTHVNGRKEIFLPWAGFNGNPSALHTPPPAAETLAARHHPHWAACTQASRKLHSRNCQQVLGSDLNSPVQFVLFYSRESKGRVLGGSAMAVAIAEEAHIPTFNLWRPEIMAEWQAITRAYELARLNFWQKLFTLRTRSSS